MLFSALAALPQAQSTHRACNDADPELSAKDKGVVVDDEAFTRNGRRYDFRIFGLGAANPADKEKPYEICLRYEFENRSNGEIQELRWKDAGIPRYPPISPGERIRSQIDKQSTTMSTVTDDTTIGAFEGAAATGETVFAVQQTIDRSAAPQKDSGERYSLLAEFPGLRQQLTAAGASDDAVWALYAERNTDYAPLNANLRSGLVAISIESSATVSPSDRFASIKGLIQVTSKIEGRVTVVAPALAALQQAKFADESTVQGRAAAFLKIVPQSKEPLPQSGPAFTPSITFRTLAGTGAPSLFIVEHPVTVTIGTWSVCVMAPAYSPVSVTLTDTHCRTLQVPKT
jgi:hypothetical protein